MAHLEVWGPKGAHVTTLDGAPVTIGRAKVNTIVLTDDPEASRVHATIQCVAGTWCIRDLGSRNGTVVNGVPARGERVLANGDELRLGSTRLVFRGDHDLEEPSTVGAKAPPELTRREREVLLALFRPALHGAVFTEPATTREIAAALSVSDAAVKQHLLRLYDKFGIHGEGERRRVRLANEALRQGAVSLAEVRERR